MLKMDVQHVNFSGTSTSDDDNLAIFNASFSTPETINISMNIKRDKIQADTEKTLVSDIVKFYKAVHTKASALAEPVEEEVAEQDIDQIQHDSELNESAEPVENEIPEQGEQNNQADLELE
jgi:hypothetical protein